MSLKIWMNSNLICNIIFCNRNAKCNYHHHNGHSAIRMCNTYWRSQKLISEVGMESFLLGMISQISEREDHILVEDLRGNFYVLISS